ncbi:lysophospholipase L1-like esterase [Elusimicrobium simillimum]|uniref:SGNH/GDSL hydrolase family protein n=1 Tax=Elusimicrobium simillimum TaxID=3143438 RepID=UPI003C6F42D4
MKKIIVLLFAASLCACAAPAVKKENAVVVPGGTSVVCFGDSLTYGKGSSEGNSYPDVLAGKIDSPVVNLGVNSETAVQALKRLDSVFEHNPYIVIIEFGGNDVLQGVPFNETLKAIRTMVTATQQHGAVAVVVAVGDAPFMRKYNDAYKKIAKETDSVFVPGIYDGFFDDDSLKADYLHPNDTGYAVFAQRIFYTVDKLKLWR